MKSLFTICLLLFIATSSFAQSINDYKYIIVPERFEFQKDINQYGLNTATKQQLRSFGFITYLSSDVLPLNSKDNLCDILTLKALNNSGMIRTKIKLILEDCQGKEIFVSEEGSSKEKLFKKAYTESFREALVSFEAIDYKYTPINASKSLEVSEISEREVIIKEGIVVKNLPQKKITSIEKPIEVKKVTVNLPSSIATGNTISYQSIDGFYKITQVGNTLTFLEGKKKIGAAQAVANTKFPVKTSEFYGVGYFTDGDFVLERSIKGVGVVEMRFKKIE